MTVWDSLNLIYIVYTNRRETLPNIQTLSSSQTITETNVLDFIGENGDNPKILFHQNYQKLLSILFSYRNVFPISFNIFEGTEKYIK